MAEDYSKLSTEELEQKRDELLTTILTIREEVLEKSKQWEYLTLEVIKIEDILNGTRQNQNDQSVSGG